MHILSESEELINRANYFFPNDDMLDQILFNLCKCIPNDKDILEKTKRIKSYNSDIFLEFTDSDTDSWSNDNRFDDVRLNDGRDKKIKSKNFIFKLEGENEKKEINKTNPSSCVEWLEFVNEANGFADVKIFSPFIYQEYYTYVNRLVFFLFQKTKCLQIGDFLNNHKFLYKTVPLYMKCKNKLCVKLSHIDVSKDSYI
ncbi:conserved Plasmodium protein, unknown function [Plasmodium malariae]|uniref:Uncharacterized protein n=1 Tax=Plasmodium malariae TaxID=5858 RepID=A0A1C3KE23_PLAMA|nr:conserved Plasmodium protein, unknown function [Plasmodium malariae]